MIRRQADHAVTSRLLRYLAIPAGCGALTLTLMAATPAPAPQTVGLTQVATIPVGQNPTAMTADSVTGTIYVACTGPTPDVYAINAATNTVTATIPVDTDPRAVSVNQVTDTIYVANTTAGTISVIDGATNTVTATIPVAGAYLVAADQSGNKVFAAGSGGLAIINGATNTVTRTIAQTQAPVALSVNPVTKTLYIGYNEELAFLSAASGKTLTTIRFLYEIRNLVTDPANNVLYVAYGRYGRHWMAGYDGTTGDFIGHYILRDGTTWEEGSPVGLTVDPRSDTIFLTDRYRLVQINAKTYRQPGTATVTVNAIPVAVDLTTRTVYVARYGSPNVYAYHSSLNGA